jgi:hypothetical protein
MPAAGNVAVLMSSVRKERLRLRGGGMTSPIWPAQKPPDASLFWIPNDRPKRSLKAWRGARRRWVKFAPRVVAGRGFPDRKMIIPADCLRREIPCRFRRVPKRLTLPPQEPTD